jgi:hypothetical protein
MDDASKTCNVTLQLMQVIEFQIIEITARLGECNVSGIQRIQNRSYKCVAENVFGFTMAVQTASAVLFRKGKGQ